MEKNIHLLQMFKRLHIKGMHDGTLLANLKSCHKPVKPVKDHWKSGIQSKFLDVAVQNKCETQAELAYTND